MNKEELEKEADTYLDKKYLKDMGVRRPCKQAYLAGAEPREKRIADLEAENEQIKNSDTLCKLIGEQKRKITDLEAQIERMKWHDLRIDPNDLPKKNKSYWVYIDCQGNKIYRSIVWQGCWLGWNCIPLAWCEEPQFN